LFHATREPLPENRGAFLHEVVDLLLHRWHGKRLGSDVAARPPVSPQQLAAASLEIAATLKAQSQRADGMLVASEEVLVQAIKRYFQDSPAIARAALLVLSRRAGLVVEHQPGSYGFAFPGVLNHLAGPES
jgi:hypothetical protein